MRAEATAKVESPFIAFVVTAIHWKISPNRCYIQVRTSDGLRGPGGVSLAATQDYRRDRCHSSRDFQFRLPFRCVEC
jgi:hypothetical protein